MLTHALSLFQVRDFLREWTSRNVRARYQQSVLGWLWAIVQPLTQVVIFSIVFTRFVPINTGDVPYPVFSYVAVLPWTFLAAALPDMTESLVVNMELLTKIYFPREVLPIAALLARLMDFVIGFALLVVLMVIYHVPFYAPGLLFVPVILIVQLMLIMGLGMAFAAFNVYFRDVRSLLVLGLQVWFYASPIIYPVTMVPEPLRPLYFLNPMAGVIEAYRAVLIYQHLPGTYLALSAVFAAVLFFTGYWFFKRAESQFADIV